MNLLDKIVADKHKEIDNNKKKTPLSELEQRLERTERCSSLRKALLDESKSGIIAEIKKRSPSKGIINEKISVSDVASGYQKAGASAISVLTDYNYFHGTDSDLIEARKVTSIPILRKDFILDEYQVLEARTIGADVILLIARILSPERTKELTLFAKNLGMEVLLEIHNEKELHANINDDIDIIGINNRDLDSLNIDVIRSFNLVDKIPQGFLKISESGLSDPDTLLKLKQAGFDGFLMGENFMKEKNPPEACANFIQLVKQHEAQS